MSKKSLIAVVSVAFAMAIGFTAQTASALICCSACDVAKPPIACKHGCSPSCVDDEEAMAPSGHIVYDQVAGLCSVVMD